jgi:subtilisin family serine protease
MGRVGRLFALLAAVILLLVASFALGTPLGSPAHAQEPAEEPAVAQEGPEDAALAEPPEPEPGAVRARAVGEGRFPAQLVSSTGRVQPNQYGPRRNDPAEGIPTHAYSPFDERANRSYPCPPGGCDFVEGQVVVKLAPQVRAQRTQTEGGLTLDASLNADLRAQQIVRLEPLFTGAEPPKPNAMIESPQGELLPEPDLTRWYRAVLQDREANVYAVVEALAELPGVEWAEPVYLRKPVGSYERMPGRGTNEEALASPPDGSRDPLFAQQWHLNAAAVPQAWQYLQSQGLPPGGNRDVVVAVIDTGVDYTHPELAANMWVNSREIPGNGIDDDGNGFVDDVHGANVVGPTHSHSGNPMDDHGHGTHVAGIIAAGAGNGVGGVGVAYNAQIMAIKAAQYSGFLSTSDIAEGIYYAVTHGASVINMSYGGYVRSQVEEDALAVAFGQAVLVAAAGNDGLPNLPCPSGRNMYPAAYNWVLGVMASDQGGGRAGFSNSDCTPRDAQEYELMAPGVGVWATLPGEVYAAWSGTSMAAPVVSGIAALARTRWADKDVYSSRFIMGQIAANAVPVANAHAALTHAPRPELSYLEHWLFDTPELSAVNDNDGIVDAGETIDLAIVIRNHWGTAYDVSITLDAWAEGAVGPDPYVTMQRGTVSYGSVGSFNIKDNGLIYDAEGAIIGVRTPFRFTVSPNTPNDHLIPFRLTITARNGLDPADQTTYTFTSRFYLIVQRGRELPRIISQDMTLTKDYYWLVPDRTLIEAGVTVRVAEGTQIQFWSADPSDPYRQNAKPLIQVEGELMVQGTASAPVELFNGSHHPGYVVELLTHNNGQIRLHHTKILNPYLHDARDAEGDNYPPVGRIMVDHSYFSQELFSCVYYRFENPSRVRCVQPRVFVAAVSQSIFHKLGTEPGAYFSHRLTVWSSIEGNLYDSSNLSLRATGEGNVFLKNYKLSEGQWGERSYFVSRAENAGGGMYKPTFALSLGPDSSSGRTYFAASSHMMPLDVAERYANRFGGHVVTINDAAENDFLRLYWMDNLEWDRFHEQFSHLSCGTLRPCHEWFTNHPWIGLTNRAQVGVWEWINGEAVTFSAWAPGQPDYTVGKNFVRLSPWNRQWYVDWDYNLMGTYGGQGPWLMEIPGTWSQSQLDQQRDAFIAEGEFNTFHSNAILNVWSDPDSSHWMRFYAVSPWTDPRNWSFYLTNNYWGTTSTTLIDSAIHDYNDDFNLPRIPYQPILTTPPEDAYPFVVDVVLSVEGNPRATTVGAEPVTFTVTFNRDMDPSVQPMVSFGPDVPYTDFTVHNVQGGWQNARTWAGTFNITPMTGDGYQFIRVAGARAADDPWLVTGDDSERFRFVVATSGTEAMNLQASGGEGFIDLMWHQTDFDLLAGFNLYKASSPDGQYSRINNTIIPPHQRSLRDTAVTPGQPYYYKFTVVKTDMTESDFSNTATAAPRDTIPPVVSHTPVTQAPPGLPLTIFADVTDNVRVQEVRLFTRPTGTTSYTRRIMTLTTGNRYALTLDGSLVRSPGLQYYIEASDGVTLARSGHSNSPHAIVVVDRPVVNVVSPNRGPASGGTAVTISGSNFRTGATVTMGVAACLNVVVVSSSQITCTTPAHFPIAADITVMNPDGQGGTLLRGFTFQSTTALLSLPVTGGERDAIVQIPITAANVQGLAAADITVTFDNNVIRARGATAGLLAGGWSLVANTNIPGEIRISMASPGAAVSGEGTLAVLEFEVRGSPGTSSPLQLAQASLNDGAISVEATHGSFAVNVAYQISGRVRYWQGNRDVPNTQLTLSGNRTYSTVSAANGSFSIGSVLAGSYTLRPSKMDHVSGISAYDASLVLQHAAGLITLNSNAARAADVNKSGSVTSFDAFYILQKSVDLITVPFPGAGMIWDFKPLSMTYNNLSANQVDQLFIGILLGDVSGNWTADGASAAASTLQTLDVLTGNPVTVALVPGTLDPTGEITTTVHLDTAGNDVYSVELVLTYAPDEATFVALETGPMARGFITSVNAETPGQVRVALAGALPMSGNGDLLTITLKLAEPAKGQSNLRLTHGAVNEGETPVEMVNDVPAPAPLYLPLVSTTGERR